jgi:hypothetical protein
MYYMSTVPGIQCQGKKGKKEIMSRTRDIPAGKARVTITEILSLTLGQKIDAVAFDLAAHRRDAEAHPGLSTVKEGIGPPATSRMVRQPHRMNSTIIPPLYRTLNSAHQ